MMSQEHVGSWSEGCGKDEVIGRYERKEIDFERMLAELFARDIGLRVRGETRNG